MSIQRILGIVLLVAGILLLLTGWQSTESVGDQLHETFTGRFTDSTMWYLIGGAVASVAGVLLLLARR